MHSSNATDLVIVVDDRDQPIAHLGKLQAHVAGELHRAFSVFIFNSAGQLLLQKRAHAKYHSGGLWSNTCCSHPRPGETVLAAAQRRLLQEMGLSCELEPSFSFIYRAELEHGLVEHEYDHVLIGFSDEAPSPDQFEVADVRYTFVEAIRGELDSSPESFSAWFRLAFEKIVQNMECQGNELRTAA